MPRGITGAMVQSRHRAARFGFVPSDGGGGGGGTDPSTWLTIGQEHAASCGYYSGGLSGGNNSDTSQWLIDASRFDWLFDGGYVESATAANINGIYAKAKARNPRFKLAVYCIPTEALEPPTWDAPFVYNGTTYNYDSAARVHGAASAAVAAGFTSQGAWVRKVSTGDRFAWGGGGPFGWRTDTTLTGPTVGGKYYVQAYADYVTGSLYAGLNSEIKVFGDNYQWSIGNTAANAANYRHAGVDEQPNVAAVKTANQEGLAAFASRIKANGREIIVNSMTGQDDMSGAMAGIVNGCFQENALGDGQPTWDTETGATGGIAGWLLMMTRHRQGIDNAATGSLCMVSQGSIAAVSTGTTTEYRYFRYLLCSVLLQEMGHVAMRLFYYDGGGVLRSNPRKWYDEYELRLGSPTSAAWVNNTSPAWQNGIYRRDFEGGCVLVNPRGNGARSGIVIDNMRRAGPADFGKSSAQWAGNNGLPVNASNPLSLADGDGIVLLNDRPPCTSS